VVQVAGANLYLNAGADSGITSGDTLRAAKPGSESSLGALLVITATPGRSVVGFLGTPFSVTRGDTLVVTSRVGAAAVMASAPVVPAAQPPVLPRLSHRSYGAIGFEFNGAQTTTYGLGPDPTRNTEEFATPAVRFRWGIQNPSSNTGLSLNLVATHRAGPSTLFDEETAVRVYEARFDQAIGHNTARISVGRFLSNFDYSSGYWDGAMLRFGNEHGLSAGIAGGFEPDRTNETFNSDAPKYAAFVNLRVGHGGVRYRNDIAFHQMLAQGAIPGQYGIDWSERLDAGAFHIGHDVEATRDPFSGRWDISRFQARLSAPLSGTNELYAAVVSDKPTPIDTTSFGLVLDRRERGTFGFSHRSTHFYSDLDFTMNSPFSPDVRGEAAGLSLGVTGGRLTVFAYANYFTFPHAQGVFGNPGVEYRFGAMRTRISYQYLLNESAMYSVTTHGADLMLARALSAKIDWMTRFNVRLGDNVRSAGVYTSLDYRF
jgi:hypothetical protein